MLRGNRPMDARAILPVYSYWRTTARELQRRVRSSHYPSASRFADPGIPVARRCMHVHLLPLGVARLAALALARGVVAGLNRGDGPLRPARLQQQQQQQQQRKTGGGRPEGC